MYQELQTAAEIAQIMAVIGVAVFSARAARKRALKTEVEALRERMTTVEQAVQYGPGHKDIERLNDRLDGLHGDLKEMSGALSGLRRAVDLMNEHLLNHRGDR